MKIIKKQRRVYIDILPEFMSMAITQFNDYLHNLRDDYIVVDCITRTTDQNEYMVEYTYCTRKEN